MLKNSKQKLGVRFRVGQNLWLWGAEGWVAGKARCKEAGWGGGGGGEGRGGLAGVLSAMCVLVAVMRALLPECVRVCVSVFVKMLSQRPSNVVLEAIVPVCAIISRYRTSGP